MTVSVCLCQSCIQTATGEACFVTSIALSIICIIILAFLIGRFLMRIFWHGKGLFHLPHDDYMTLAFIFTIIVYVLSLYMTMRVPFKDYEDKAIVRNSIALTIMCLVPASLPGRLARNKFAHTEKLLDLKQHFVRYISHEMRTPMNVASVGIDLLDSTLQDAGVTDPEALERICDVKEAIHIAIEILNDILTYEKISSNLMVLEKSLQSPMALVTNNFRMFQQEAIKKGVVLNIPGQGSFEDILLGERKFNVDIMKIGQVLRNLASNALKFTPSGGSITVVMSIRSNKNISNFVSLDDSYSSRGSSLGSLHRHLSSVHTARGGERSISGSMQQQQQQQSGAPNASTRQHIMKHRRKEFLQIDVIDTGAGIAVHNIGKVQSVNDISALVD